MGEVTGPVVAIDGRCCSPCSCPRCMMPGLTGRLYQQFAMTISIATVFSSINALTLSPALCRLLLKPAIRTPKPWFFRKFNEGLREGDGQLHDLVGGLLRKSALTMVVFVVMLVATWSGFIQPAGRLPPR